MESATETVVRGKAPSPETTWSSRPTALTTVLGTSPPLQLEKRYCLPAARSAGGVGSMTEAPPVHVQTVVPPLQRKKMSLTVPCPALPSVTRAAGGTRSRSGPGEAVE